MHAEVDVGSSEQFRIDGLVVGRKSDGRGIYDPSKKAQLVQLCQRSGVSVKKAAQANGIDYYLLRMWIAKSETLARRAKRMRTAVTPVSNALIPVSVPQFTTLQTVPSHEIELVLPRGLLRVARVDSAMLSQLIDALR